MSFNKDEYEFRKIDALSQFHIIRRLAPIIGELMAAVVNSGAIKNVGKPDDVKIEDVDFEALAKDITPVMDALAKLPDEAANFALFGLLKAVSYKNFSVMSPIMTAQNQFLFDHIKDDLQLMLTLAAKSFMFNMSGFLNALPSGLKEGALQSKPIG